MTGAYPLDIDGDGITDLVLLRVGENVVMRGLGNCQFERANELWGFDGGDAWSTAFAATWEKGAAGRLWPSAITSTAARKLRRGAPAPTTGCTGLTGRRTSSRHPWRSSPVFARCRCCSPTGTGPARRRLRVSNDREYYEGGQEQLWHVDPGKAPALYTEKEGWKPLRIWGMGIAGYDLDFDGYPEYFLTSMADNKLQTLATVPQDGKPRGHLQRCGFAKGVTAHRPYTGGDCAPARPGTRNLKTSTMTAWSICSSPKAMSPRCRTLPRRTPTICCCKALTASSRKRARRRALPAWPYRGARLWPISTWTACWIWWWSTAGKKPNCGATPAPMRATGSRSNCSNPVPTVMRSAPGLR